MESIRWWRIYGMVGARHDLLVLVKEAQQGHVLPFVTELGPPDYAITNPNYLSSNQVEISDRWEQALVLKRLGEESWKRAWRQHTLIE